MYKGFPFLLLLLFCFRFSAHAISPARDHRFEQIYSREWEWRQAQRLEEDEDWKNHSSIVTVEFFDCEGGTEPRLTHEKLPNEASRDDHTQGWNSVLDKLEKFLL